MKLFYRFQNLYNNVLVIVINLLACAEVILSLRMLQYHFPYEIDVTCAPYPTCEILDYTTNCQKQLCLQAEHSMLNCSITSTSCESHRFVSSNFHFDAAVIVVFIIASLHIVCAIAYTFGFCLLKKKMKGAKSIYRVVPFSEGKEGHFILVTVFADLVLSIALAFVYGYFKAIEIQEVNLGDLADILKVEYCIILITIICEVGLDIIMIREAYDCMKFKFRDRTGQYAHLAGEIPQQDKEGYEQFLNEYFKRNHATLYNKYQTQYSISQHGTTTNPTPDSKDTIVVIT